MKRVWIVLFLVVAVAACGGEKKAAEQPAAGASPAPADAAAPTAAVPNEAQPAATGPDIPADQSAPENALFAFFAALNVALDQDFQAANRAPEKDPAKARRYQEARARLRQLFLTGNANTEICAYLDLIRMKKAEIVGQPDINGDKATIKVHLIKGDNLSLDPMSFGEDSKTEATVTVKLIKIDGNWRIEDFGGLVAKARAQLQG